MDFCMFYIEYLSFISYNIECLYGNFYRNFFSKYDGILYMRIEKFFGF